MLQKNETLAVLGAEFVAADIAVKTNQKLADDFRRDLLRGLDRRVHHAQRLARMVGTGLVVVLIVLVLLKAFEGHQSGNGSSHEPNADTDRRTRSTP